MQMPITAEDVVVGIFYFMKKNDKTTQMTADRETLHRAFFKAAKKYSVLNSLFSFRQRELFPESSQLDQALSNLDATGIISRRNLTPKYYYFEKPLEKSYKNFSKKILCKAGINEDNIKTVAATIAKSI